MELKENQSLHNNFPPDELKEGDVVLFVKQRSGLYLVPENYADAFSAEIYEIEYFGGYFKIKTEFGTITHRRDLLSCKVQLKDHLKPL